MEFIDKWTSPRLTDLAPQISRFAANLTFDVIEQTDSRDGLRSDGRTCGYLNVVELAPERGPACGFNDPAAFIEMMESRIMWPTT
jgi:hypothetical protein